MATSLCHGCGLPWPARLGLEEGESSGEEMDGPSEPRYAVSRRVKRQAAMSGLPARMRG